MLASEMDMNALDPFQILGTLRAGGDFEHPVCVLQTVGIGEAVVIICTLLEKGPPAVGFLGVHPGYHWFPTPNLHDAAAVVGEVQAMAFEVRGSSLSVLPSNNPHDPWIAFVLELHDAESGDECEVRDDLDDAAPGTPDTSTEAPEETQVGQLHAGLLERAGLKGVPSLVANGVLDQQGQISLAGVLCLVRGVQPPVPASWQIAIEWFGSDPVTVRKEGLAPIRFRTWSPPLPIAMDAILDEISVARLFRGRHAEHARAALAEILVNAVAHRCYESGPLEPIRVRVYPDRVVVVSPGGWNGGGTVDGTTGEEREDRIFNPRLHALLAALGFCRQQGLGLERARMFGRAVGMRLELDFGEAHVTASLVVDRQRSLEIEAPERERSAVLKAPAMVRQERVLDLLRRRVSASKKEIAEALGIPAPSVAKTLKELMEAGLVVRTDRSPRSPLQRYRGVEGD